MTRRIIKRALISVSDKTGIEDFARALAHQGIELISTGGTAAALRKAGLAVRDVSEVTGFPEIMDGRVKTLHPKIHGGLLAQRDRHDAAMREHAIAGIDLLVCNLYPFEAAVVKNASFEEAVENIDIGGPAMIRGAAKNHEWVTVVVDPEDYSPVAAEIAGGGVEKATRSRLAQIAFARTAAYDSAVSEWLAGELARDGDAEPPRRRSFAGRLRQKLRYGENPHQQAAFYVTGESRFGVATARQLQGKELSYNNINDTDAGYELAAEFGGVKPTCVIVKHANPCGVATAETLADAYRNALACDPVSAFGGVLAFNRSIDADTAELVANLFIEVIIAPEADSEAIRILSARKNLRLLIAGGLPDPHAEGWLVRSVAGGLLVQNRDTGAATAESVRVVTRRAPTGQELADMLFAFTVVKHVKSNAIVFVKDGSTAGIGAGQMSRVDSARMAAIKAGEAAAAAHWPEPRTIGSAAASDAFFPFPDGLIAIAEAGATAVIQPGGSVRDDEVIKEADARGLAMVFTGVRHFRH
ncbi:MAG: bifunctional phosphoribosylaminoimidazolecarboxamide formyltransferase/IMP cyclohydrolase [Alphaproteobacteria bacterium]|nr:bifunctional phosphoribosylaminoimidazolecarboxamide formyltransferase/IMP cyclohydrolase [Alphaproteobacteria bacterium]